MREWWSPSDLVGMPGMPGTARAIRKRAAQQDWESRPRQGQGGGSEFHLSSLPPETRAHIASLTSASPAEAGAAEGRRVAIRGAIDERATWARRQQGLAGVSRLSPAAQARMDARAELLRIIDDYAAAEGISRQAAELQICSGAAEHVVPPEIASVVGRVSTRTIARWRAQLRDQGLAALGGQYRKRTTAIDRDPEVKALIMGMLHDHPHVTGALVMRALRARFDSDVVPPPRTVQRWIAAYREDNAQLLLAVANPDAWRSRYRAAGGCASESIVRPNQLWELDSTPGDLLLADGCRHAIVGCIDVRTRRFKLQVSRTSRSTAIAALLRRCLIDWGVPEVARTDEGSDYTSKHIRRVFEGLEVYQHILPPFSPERKPFIERAFRTFSHDLLELLAGYVGHNVADRKAIESRRSFADRLMRRGTDPVELRLTPEELQDFCDRWTDDVYAHDTHDGLGGETPFAVTAAWTGVVRRIEDVRALDVLLSEAAGDGWRVITKKGLRIDSGTYDHPDMGGREGERVRVLIDEHDYGHVYVFAADGEFICRAFDPQRTGISRAEVAAQRRKIQRQVIKAGKAELVKIAREARTKDIVQDILQDRAAKAGKLAHLPPRAEAYITNALTEARRAARVDDMPQSRELSAEEKALQQQIAAPARVVSMPETPAQRYRRAARMERDIAAGLPVTEDSRRWLTGYQQTVEYKSEKAFHQQFGISVDAENQ
jgi:transposase